MSAGRGSTGPGRPASSPAGEYAPPAAVRDKTSELVVGFHGEDGRAATLAVHELPLPGWHGSLAAALATRVGPAGALRTRAAVVGSWQALSRLMRLLATLPDRPAVPAALSVGHLEQFQ